jgi:sugar phosphate isomerase/epimerase
MTRREALLAPLPVLAAQSAKRPIRLGGPIYLKSDDPAALAREHRRLGYAAAYCPRVSVKETEKIRAIEKAYQAENVVIAEVGVWVNMLDADPAKRKENIQRVTDGLALADAVGARCCVDIAGSFNEKVWYGPHPKNFSKEFFDAAVDNARKIIDAVKPKRAKFAYEMMGWCLPHDADTYLDLLRAIDRPAFGVHIDVCNGINSPQRFYNNAAFTRDLFAKLGRYAVSCHAKDLAWLPEMNVHFVEVIPGRGEIDYRPQLEALAALPNDVPLMLEHLKTAEEYAEGAQFIRNVGSKIGVQFA